MIGVVQKRFVVFWFVWVLGSSVHSQIGEEPVRKAELVGEPVRVAAPVVEEVRRADPVDMKNGTALDQILSTTPKVIIQSPQEGQVMPWETVDVFVQVENLTIREDEHRLHVIVDNGSPIEHTSILRPVILRGMAPGAHTLRIFAVKPDGKMLTNPEAFMRVDFYVRRQDFSNLQPVS